VRCSRLNSFAGTELQGTVGGSLQKRTSSFAFRLVFIVGAASSTIEIIEPAAVVDFEAYSFHEKVVVVVLLASFDANFKRTWHFVVVAAAGTSGLELLSHLWGSRCACSSETACHSFETSRPLRVQRRGFV
jgi:hypothetical protein